VTRSAHCPQRQPANRLRPRPRARGAGYLPAIVAALGVILLVLAGVLHFAGQYQAFHAAGAAGGSVSPKILANMIRGWLVWSFITGGAGIVLIVVGVVAAFAGGDGKDRQD